MDDAFTVIISEPRADGLVAAALASRACDGRVECLVRDSQDLLSAFAPEVRRKLPHSYDMILCGLSAVRTDWAGRLVRPELMDALRGFLGPITWYSSRRWEAEDRRAVAHAIGEGNLHVATDRSASALVAEHALGGGDDYERSLVRFAERRLSPAEMSRWGADLDMVLTALKDDPGELATTIAPMADGRVRDLAATHAARARGVESRNRQFTADHAGDPIEMGEARVVVFDLPPTLQAHWQEIGACARESADAAVSICRLEGRDLLLVARGEAETTDLRVWTRYVTDLMPAVRCVGAQADVVPLLINGLDDGDELLSEVLGLLADGAHLLRSHEHETRKTT